MNREKFILKVLLILAIVVIPDVVHASCYSNTPNVLIQGVNFYYYEPSLHGVPPHILFNTQNIIQPSITLENGMLKLQSVFTNNNAHVFWTVGTVNYKGYLKLRAVVMPTDTWDSGIIVRFISQDSSNYLQVNIHNGWCKRSHAFVVTAKGDSTIEKSDDGRGTNDWTPFNIYIIDGEIKDGVITLKLLSEEGDVMQQYVFSDPGLDYGLYYIQLGQGEGGVCKYCGVCNQAMIGYYKEFFVSNGVETIGLNFNGVEFLKHLE